jgi:hypothetical protein
MRLTTDFVVPRSGRIIVGSLVGVAVVDAPN